MKGAKSSWALAGLMWVAYCLNHSDRQVVFSMFPVLKAKLGFTDAELGLTGSLFLWAYAGLSPIAGNIADRVSKRRLIITSLVLWSGLTALTGLASRPACLLAGRAAMAITEALFYPAAVALLVAATSTTARSKVFSLFATSQLAGVVLGGWYGSFMAQEHDWRWAFFSLGLAGTLYAVPFWTFLKRVAEPAASPAQSRLGVARTALALLRIPTYRVVTVVSAAFVLAQWFLYAWLPNLLYEKYHLTLVDAGVTAAAYVQVSALVGTVAGGFSADRLHPRTPAARLWIVSVALVLFVAPGLALLGAAATLARAKVGIVGFGIGSGLMISSLNIAAFDVVPREIRASALGFLNMLSGMTSGLAPFLGGLWKQSVGAERMLFANAALCLAAAVLLVVTVKKHFARDSRWAEGP